MTPRFLIVALALGVALFAGHLPQQVRSDCTTTSVNTLISNVNSFTNSIPSSVEDVDKYVHGVLANATYTDCLQLIDSMIDIKSTRYETVVTDECREVSNSTTAYDENPCCNIALQESSCCQANSIVEVQPVASVFKSSPITCSAKNWEKTRAVVRHHFRVNEKRHLVCEKYRSREYRKIKMIIENLKACPTEIMRDDIPCISGSHCYSGICKPKDSANPLELTCVPPSVALGKSVALAQCIKKHLPNDALRHFQGLLSLSKTVDSTDESLNNALINTISSSKCVNENIQNSNNTRIESAVVDSLTSDATCTAVKRCTDGSETCANGNNFCGAFCGSNGICETDVTSLTSEGDCLNPENAIGTCKRDKAFHQTKGLKTLINNDDCSESSFCSIHCPGCNELDCQENTGTCFKFPFTGSKCVLPFENTGSPYYMKKCPGTSVDVEFGCLSTFSVSDCSKAGGKWITAPSSQEACEKTTQNEDVVQIEQLYLACNEGSNVFSSKYKTTCTACGFQNTLLFEWRMGLYLEGEWTQQTKWVKREMKSVYSWTPVLDESKYLAKLNELEELLVKGALRSYAQCSILPTLQNLKDIACSCAGGTSCFEETPAVIGTVTAFPGVQSRVDIKDALVITKLNSVAAEENISFGRVPVHMEPQGLQFENVPVEYPVTGDKKGFVAGHGISVPKNFANGIDLCIQIDSQLYSIYATPIFVVKDSSGQFVKSDSAVSFPTLKPSMACATVYKSGVYYPAFVNLYDDDTEYGGAQGSFARTSIFMMVATLSFILMLLL